MVKERRPKILQGMTYEIKTGCGALHIIINDRNNIPYELFSVMGKGGGCASSQCEALGRVISLSFKNDVPVKDLIKHLSGISCHSPVIGDEKVSSCSDAIAQVLKMYLVDKEKIEKEKADKENK